MSLFGMALSSASPLGSGNSVAVKKYKKLSKTERAYHKMVQAHVAEVERQDRRREYKKEWQRTWRCIPENRINEKVQANLREINHAG